MSLPFPAEYRASGLRMHLVDDKPRIRAAVKETWGERVTTILTVERIGDLVAHDLSGLLPLEVTT